MTGQRFACVAFVTLFFFASVAVAVPDAIVRLFGTDMSPSTLGWVRFERLAGSNSLYNISFDISGLAPNTGHGVHIHQWGDITHPNGTNAGAHFNPFSQPHACYPTVSRHEGDLGTIFTDSNGINRDVWTRDLLNFTFDGSSNPKASCIGRAIIVHQNIDDCTTQPTGASGNRYAQGVIGISQTAASNIGSDIAAAAAVLSGKFVDSNGAQIGTVWMRYDPAGTGKVQVYLRITSGVSAGAVHGLHVHQFGDFTDQSGFTSAGVHWNPDAQQHALPYEAGAIRHAGDLGNVMVASNGQVYHSQLYDVITLGGLNNIAGRGIILHRYPDQGVSAQTVGLSGARIGMAVLGVADPNNWPTTLESAPVMSAYVKMFGTALQPSAAGSIRIVAQSTSEVEISISLTGLPVSATLGMHIHEFGDITSPNGVAAGLHFNPYLFPHACFPTKGQRHVGDLGNIQTDVNGAVTTVITRDWVTLSGDNSTIGRAIIVHALVDDCTTQPTGGSGSRLAQGVIGIERNLTYTQTASNPSRYLGVSSSFTTLVSTVTPTTGNTAAGTVWFRVSTINAVRTQVMVNLTGVSPVSANHGIHVHTYGDWSLPDATAADAHWNPNLYQHALPSESSMRHAGDFGNFMADAAGNIYADFEVDSIPIGMIDLVGRAVVVHALPDQGQSSQPNGNAGARIAMGVIGISNSVFPMPPSTLSSSGVGCLGCSSFASANSKPSFVITAVAIAALAAFLARRNV